MEQVQRTVQLKAIHWKSGRKKGFKPRPVQELLHETFASRVNAEDRYFVKQGSGATPTRNCTTHHLHDAGTTYFFEFLTYTPDDEPQQMTPDLSSPNVELSTGPMTNEDGDPVELATAFQVLACGDVLLIEYRSGSGGSTLLGHYLTAMFRRQYGDKYPGLALMDVPNAAFKDAINRGGGVQSVSMKMLKLATENTPKFGKRLSDTRGVIRDAELVSVVFENRHAPLNTDDVIDALEEAENETGVEGVVVQLRDSSKLTGLHKLKVRKTFSVADAGSGNAARGEMRLRLGVFLSELRAKKDGVRVLDAQGRIIK